MVVLEVIGREWTLVQVAAYAALAYVVYKVVEWYFTCPEVYGRHGFKQNLYEENSYKRRQLDKLRAESGEFPPPYPNGWYKIAESAEVPKGKVVTVSALGREFVVFRGKEDGVAGVIDAFCPHLGTHLGHGGQVVGNNIQCPYHLWEFNSDGENKNIPYCKKDMSGSKRVNVKKFTTYESPELGSIFFWYHCEDKEPEWELHPGLSEIEKDVKSGKMRRVSANRWSDMMMHVFEASQNSADYFHFSTVHQYLPMPFNLKLVKADHIISTIYGAEGTEVTKESMMIRERLDRLRVFGWNIFTLPSFIKDSIITYVHIQGPNNVVFKVDTILGSFRAHYAMLPLEPFRQKATIVMYADRKIPFFVARLLHWWIEETVGQDRQVWEHKKHVAPRNLVVGDGPFAQYGKWIEQFYTEKSYSWNQFRARDSLEW
ncbi:Cholesterol 7-desaturase nvd 1 (Neverland 1) (Nvd-Ci-1) [Durusdinium trenchii]|uniref:cholesterol 7-desaturase n=1 Tax=Durusdinium trenchii TaxID=1381693 RepID=A0ABP0JP20_9DINO